MIRKIESNCCIGCGICELVCPGDVIRMDKKKKKAYIKYPGDCWTCFNCELECPTMAIDVGPFRKAKPMAW